nr:hypothetical protein 4 [bacterium]BDD47214.1 hypothetical protein 7 [bacterium]
MANKQRGYVEIELDKTRQLKFDFNALAEMEDVLQKPITQMNGENIGLKELRALLYAGLKHEEPGLTLDKAGQLIALDRVEKITEKVMEAFSLAFGDMNQAKNEQASVLSGAGKK